MQEPSPNNLVGGCPSQPKRVGWTIPTHPCGNETPFPGGGGEGPWGTHLLGLWGKKKISALRSEKKARNGQNPPFDPQLPARPELFSHQGVQNGKDLQTPSRFGHCHFAGLSSVKKSIFQKTCQTKHTPEILNRPHLPFGPPAHHSGHSKGRQWGRVSSGNPGPVQVEPHSSPPIGARNTLRSAGLPRCRRNRPRRVGSRRPRGLPPPKCNGASPGFLFPAGMDPPGESFTPMGRG